MVDITELKQYNINISTGDRHMKEFVCELGEDFALDNCIIKGNEVIFKNEKFKNYSCKIKNYIASSNIFCA